MMAKTYDGQRKSAKLPADSIVTNPRNPRIHDEEQLEGLVESLRHFGQARPVLVRAENRMLIAGHGVFEAATRAGLTEIDAVLWNVSQKQADEYLIADNRHHDKSTDDAARIAALLRDLEPENYLALGFDDDELAKFLGDDEDEPLKVTEIAAGEVSDRFWISITGPLPQQALALQRLQEVMQELADVDVQLGTQEGL
jgi:ParB-like chromosome segregation protein Spo0J